ncbi:MAG TPA: glycosyltransferase [Candidatus Wujingus californicus]|uniref:glycosyltransferase n=2 Tax=Candidatus Wujingus californicus TaxID=3367618 RepID=UPI004026AF14
MKGDTFFLQYLMKILHIFKDYYPVVGGIENHIKILAESQAQNGLDVTVLTTSPFRETVIENVNAVKVIKTSRITAISSTPISISLFKWVRKLNVDITHLHFPYPIGEFAHLLFGHSSRTVITYHNDIVKQKYLLQLYKPFLMSIFKKADCIITTSPQLIKTSPVLNSFENKCKVIPYGIDIGRFSNPNKLISSKLRDKFNANYIVLFVGRLRYFKGLEYLIDAMKFVNATLLIIGAGAEENTLKAKVCAERLKDKIIFLGELANDDLPEYFDASDIFVLPSSHRSESFGIVLIEAMACGKAVISTELGTGTSFVNVHEKTGLVVPPKDPNALSNAINRLLSDEPLRKKCELNAKRRSEEFSKEHLFERVSGLYREILSN